MSYYGKFSDALRDTEMNLMMQHGPLWQIWSNAMGDCVNDAVQYKFVMISALWAIAQDFVLQYELQHRLLLGAMGHITGFYYVLLAIGSN
jgi:hypothetical protein